MRSETKTTKQKQTANGADVSVQNEHKRQTAYPTFARRKLCAQITIFGHHDVTVTSRYGNARSVAKLFF